MGVSTDGILCFGVDIGDDIPEWLERYEEEPELVEAEQVQIVQHCSHNYPMYIIAARGSVHRAYRGSPVDVDITISAIDEINLQKFLSFHGITEKPRWLLASLWR